MYRDMDQWIEIHRRVLVEGVSKRQILRETGMHWKTLEKILRHSHPPGYRRSEPPMKPANRRTFTPPFTYDYKLPNRWGLATP